MSRRPTDRSAPARRDAPPGRPPATVVPAKPAPAEAPPQPAPIAAAVAAAGVPQGARGGGWLPDAVLVGDRFEAGMAFFADATGRLTRFSREPADLAQARRLPGVAALPGLVDAHAYSWQRFLRGRALPGTDPAGGAAGIRLLARLTPEDAYDAANVAFLELLRGGVTCVADCCLLRDGAPGGPPEETLATALAVARAAHEVGIRLALVRLACVRSAPGEQLPPRLLVVGVDAYTRECEVLRARLEREYPADEAWLVVGPLSLAAVPAAACRVIGEYARAQRLRLQAVTAATPAAAAALRTEHGRPEVAALAELGLVDKRFTAVGGGQLDESELRLIGTARGAVCALPGTAAAHGWNLPAPAAVRAAGAGLALGSGAGVRLDLLEEARWAERRFRLEAPPATSPAALALQAATTMGARSLGATGGGLEVGRPADFFTVSLAEPSLAGADPASLATALVQGGQLRAVRDVWVGARQRLAGGRHLRQGAILGRFIETQARLQAG
ncbi:MAG: amidohydrolase family protein [Verrucomicrobia bacterium]|nr:amidohydrolase family protein [Verrucomicrobiota bacterium]